VTELSADDKTQLGHIVQRVEQFEQTLGSFYRDGLWSRMDRLYHAYTDFKRTLRDTRGRDRRDIIEDARKDFGHPLHIPYAFAIVETVLPALLSNRPRILILPGGMADPRNVENMKALIDEQQGNIGLELRLQSVGKSGLMYGLGVGKSYWLRREGKRTQLKELATFHPERLLGHTHQAVTVSSPLFDDPTFEHVPVRDFFWDPFAANIDGARWAAHRTWRDTDYVLARLQDSWKNMTLTREDVDTPNGSADRYRKSVQGSFDAQGIPVPNPQGARETDVHEVIEYHDRGQIITILDRQWVVMIQENETNYGILPFQIYRPTEVLNQFVGKGEIEPVEDPIEEMNDIRTDRRWNAAMSQAPVLFYNDGMIDPDQIRVGPAS
jgi:hypothetical protein